MILISFKNMYFYSTRTFILKYFVTYGTEEYITDPVDSVLNKSIQ
jgi:hypothetical protein